MGAFAPAIYLAENRFDIIGLLQQPDWWLGGPNTHSLSLFTWLVALVLKLTGSAKLSFVLLHVFVIAVNAWALSHYVQALEKHGFVRPVAFASALYVALCPLVLVQIGYLYTESLVMALGLVAFSKWTDGQEGWAVLAIIVAMAVKLTGVVLAASLIFAMLVSVPRYSLRRGLWVILLVGSYCFLKLLPSWLGRQPPTHSLDWGSSSRVLQLTFERCLQVPDISALFLLGLLCALVSTLWFLKSEGLSGAAAQLESQGAVLESCWMAQIMPVAFICACMVFVAGGGLMLARYWTPAIPFIVYQGLRLGQQAKRQDWLLLALSAACLVAVYNSYGALYAPRKPFSIVERSHDYKHRLKLQQQAVKGLEGYLKDLPEESRGRLVFVSREIDYFTDSPLMGYTDIRMPQLRGIYKPPFKDWPLKDFPPAFALLLSNSSHGGQRIQELVAQAKARKEWRVTLVFEIRHWAAPVRLWVVERAPQENR